MTEWTDTMVARLRDMHEAGATYGEIGAALGVTRSAALGKGNRIGLRVRKSTVAARPKPPADRRSDTRADGTFYRKGGIRSFVKEPTYRDLPVETSPSAVSLMNLKPGTCRWPVSGDGAATMFCGEPQANDGCSYCEAHKLRSIARREAA